MNRIHYSDIVTITRTGMIRCNVNMGRKMRGFNFVDYSYKDGYITMVCSADSGAYKLTRRDGNSDIISMGAKSFLQSIGYTLGTIRQFDVVHDGIDTFKFNI